MPAGNGDGLAPCVDTSRPDFTSSSRNESPCEQTSSPVVTVRVDPLPWRLWTAMRWMCVPGLFGSATWEGCAEGALEQSELLLLFLEDALDLCDTSPSFNTSVGTGVSNL